jgi:thiol-disulfide isomerase/thioredoxin
VNAWVLAARLVLAAAFFASGAAKIADRAGTNEAAVAFGLPAWLAPPVASALPAVELLVGVALVPASSAALAGWAAFGLLAAFSGAVTISLARGRRPECHCFGQLTTAPIGWRTLARNAMLAGLAAFIAVAGWPAGGTSLGGVGSSRAATAVAIAALAVALAAVTALTVAVMARYGKVLRQLDQFTARPGAPLAHAGTAGVDGHRHDHGPPAGLPPGSPAPEFSVPGTDGRPVTLAGLRAAGHPVLLVFGDPGCGPCRSLLPDLTSWQAEHAERFTAALISRGSMDANVAEAREHRLTNLGVQNDQEIAVAYAYAGTPSAVAVSADGRIASQVAAGPDGVRALAAALMARAAGGPAGQPAALTPPLRGQQVPAATLPDLDGQPVDLAAPREHPLLVLFWNPACGFCQQALPEVKAREQGTVSFMFVSVGSAEANRDLALSSPVLLDPGFTTARAFGAHGTPSAVLIGADGRIASELAIGGPALLALADDAIHATSPA